MRGSIAGALAFFALGACGTSPAPLVALCVRTAPDDAPFDVTATELVLRATPLEGVQVQSSFDPATAATLSLPALDYGTWSFSLDARYGPTVKATGSTPFVEIEGSGAVVPCIYFATVGTFGDLESPPALGTVRLAISMPTSSKALLIGDEGMLPYDHATGAFGDTIAPPLPAAGAVWVSLPDGRAAMLLADGRAAIVGLDGVAEAGVATVGDVGPLDGVAAIAVGRQSILLVGGAPDADSLPGRDTLRVVDLATGDVAPLDARLPGGRLALRDARVADLGTNEFVIVGGNEGSAVAPAASRLVAVVDPEVGITSFTTLDTPRRDPALAVLGGNVLVFGGRNSSGTALDTIERILITPIGPLPLAQPSHPLVTARWGALALPLSDAVLVVGGETGTDEGDLTADRYTFETDGAVAANPPGVALPSPAAVTLHDGTVLVASGGAAVVYRP